MVETRNAIAHGESASEAIGGRFTIADMIKRVDDTEAVCSHIMAVIQAHAAAPTAFR